jgi:gas vesicle protein
MNWIFLAQMTSNDTTFIGVATTIVGALAGAVVHLYFRDATKGKELVDMVSKEFTECKKDREELRKLYFELKGNLTTISKEQK